ncbi:unnamed protein product [Nezara viridula]|uniref:Uncharacterized protein n=1 Tax=Nezara viridula TaxID=85310 RepID=A0A9P0HQX3_NEZVI|nr:unnamed protein product [Nezara viridula]
MKDYSDLAQVLDNTTKFAKRRYREPRLTTGDDLVHQEKRYRSNLKRKPVQLAILRTMDSLMLPIHEEVEECDGGLIVASVRGSPIEVGVNER